MRSAGIIVLATGALAVSVLGARWLRAGGNAPGSGPGASAPIAAAPKVVLGPGFAYSPNDSIEGQPGVTTIRLGDRLRVFAAVDRWTPATIALLGKDDAVLWSARLDLPPGGSITGSLPEVVGAEKAAISHGAGEFDAGGFERRIGVPEEEVTTQSMRDIGAVRAKERALEEPGFKVTQKDWDAQTSRCVTSLERDGARVCVIGSAYTYFGTAQRWAGEGGVGEGSAPDSLWLTPSVLDALRQAKVPAEERERAAGGPDGPS